MSATEMSATDKGRKTIQMHLSFLMYFFTLAICGIAISFPAAAQSGSVRAEQDTAGDSDAVILIYHRFGDSRYPSTNIGLDQFSAHLDELRDGPYTVMPLADIVEALRNDTPLPEKAVAITIDDAYSTVASEGWPLLREYGFPATLFVATEAVDRGYDGILSWDEIRRLRDEGLEIGHHSAGHGHFVDMGVEAARADIEKASARFMEELGSVPPVFAYPYGEYSTELEDLVESLGFLAALAQYSSVAARQEGLYSLPRFPFNEQFGDIGRFRLAARTESLSVSGVLPEGPVLDDGNNPPAYGFTLTENAPNLANLNCFPSDGIAADIEILGGNRVEVRMGASFPSGRSRINCTLPAGGGDWYWLGKFFYIP